MIYIVISPFSQNALLDKSFKQNCSKKRGKILHELDEKSPSLKQMVWKITLALWRQKNAIVLQHENPSEGEKRKRKFNRIYKKADKKGNSCLLKNNNSSAQKSLNTTKPYLSHLESTS
jgi:hypothetical protein